VNALDPITCERLIELRALLDKAKAQSGDRSVVGRHAAVILLDGACEYAIGLAGDELGVKSKEFHNLVHLLRKNLDARWQGEGMKGVLDLHAMRTSAQHHGVRADPAELPRWAADSERFVHSLVATVFGVDLVTLTLASMIADNAIKTLLAQAEQHLLVGDPAAALAALLRAFEQARRQWAGQRREAEGHRPSPPMGSHDLTAKDVRKTLALMESYAEVSPFAADLGEYVWLRSLEASTSSGPPPTLEEAQRAFSFIFGWILRWESFNSQYVSNRTGRWLRALRPPRIGEPGDPPTIIEASVEVERRHGVPDGFVLVATLQLANAPDEGFDQWLDDLRGELRKSIDGSWISLARNGRITFHGLNPETDPAALVDVVEQAFLAVDRRAQQRSEEQFRLEVELARLAEPYRERLGSIICMGVAMFADVVATPTVSGGARGPDETFRIRAFLAAELQDKGFEFSRAFFTASQPEQYLHVDSSPYAVSFSGTYTPDRCAEIAATAGQLVQEAAKAAAEQRTKEQTTRTMFEGRLRTRIGPQGRTRTNP
jgi:hypothetical protein